MLSYSSKIFCIKIDPKVNKNKNKRKDLWYSGVANHNKQVLVHDHASLYPILATSQGSDYSHLPLEDLASAYIIHPEIPYPRHPIRLHLVNNVKTIRTDVSQL